MDDVEKLCQIFFRPKMDLPRKPDKIITAWPVRGVEPKPKKK